MSTKKIPIILIYKGKLPNYSICALDKIAKNNSKIFLICDVNDKLIKNINRKIKIIDIKNYEFNLNLDYKINNFRNGFYLKTIERFFIINNFLKKNSLKNFFHIELDNFLYNLDDFKKKLDHIGNKIFFSTMPYKKKGFKWKGCPGLIYCNDPKIFNFFCCFILKKIKIKFYDDMELLYLFDKNYSKKVGILPTPYNISENYKIYKNNFIQPSFLGYLVDGVNFGIYLFGSDLRNHGRPIYNMEKLKYGVVNEFKNMKISMSEKKFILEISKNKYKLINIHVHSKMFKELFMDKFYLKIIKNLNNNKSTLISFNFKNIIKNFSISRIIKNLIFKCKKRIKY